MSDKTAVKPIEVQEAERAKPTDELGATGLASFCGLIEEAYIAELQYPTAYPKYNEMRRRNPTIASLLNVINMLSRTASWDVEPGGKTEPDKRAAEFLKQNIDDMSTTLEDSVEDMLSSIWYGWAWSEIVYKRRNGPGGNVESKYDDGMVGWRKFAPRRQSSFSKWELDASGGVQGLWQTIINDPNKVTRYVPISKSLHFTAQRDMGNPEGLPLAENCYEPWHFAKNLQILNGIGFERSFVGLPIFTYGTPDKPYDPTSDDKAIVERTGKGLRQGEKAFIALPGQIGFELLSTSNQNATSMLDAIKYYLIVILQTALADFIALGTTSTGGSYALGADKSQLFLMAVDGWLDKIAHVDKLGILNRYAVPRLFGYNNFAGITDYPRIKHSSVQKPDLAGLATYLQSLAAYIHPDVLLEADLRKKANLPEAQLPTTPPEALDPNSDGTQPDPGATPQTGDEPPAAEPASGDNAGDMSAEMSGIRDDTPRPPARGQKWYFLSQWRKMAGEFREAMGQNAEPPTRA